MGTDPGADLLDSLMPTVSDPAAEYRGPTRTWYAN